METSYCTAFIEGWWSHCCQAHDDAYDAQIGKAIADQQLRQCVAEAAPEWAAEHPQLADGLSLVVSLVMFTGVSLFGRYFYKRAGKNKAQAKP